MQTSREGAGEVEPGASPSSGVFDDLSPMTHTNTPSVTNSHLQRPSPSGSDWDLTAGIEEEEEDQVLNTSQEVVMLPNAMERSERNVQHVTQVK